MVSLAAALAPFLLVAQTPIVFTIAGGERGYRGDDAPSAEALFSFAAIVNPCDPQRFEQTSQISVDAAGNLIIADSANHRIRRMGADGIIRTVAGSGERPVINNRCEPAGSIADGGEALAARLYNPSAAVAHMDGTLVIADQQNGRIRQVAASGAISTIAGSGLHNLYSPGIPATASPMDWPTGLALDAAGLVHFTELHGNRVARIDASGRLATVAGFGFPGFSGDGLRATSAQLRKPTGIAFDRDGNLYIADTGNHGIRKVDAAGIISTIAGVGRAGFSGDDGPAAAAALNTPMDVKVDSKGVVFVADTLNHRIRRIGTDGIITTIAGTGEEGRGEDLMPAAESALSFPCAIAVDAADNLFIVDWQNHRIRKVVFGPTPVLLPLNGATTAGVEVTFAGANFAEFETTAEGEPWPEEIAGVSVEVNGARIRLGFVSAGSIRGSMPVDLAPGLATVIVRTAGGASNPVAIRIVAEGELANHGATAPIR